MSQKEKLIKRVRGNPKDFTFEELQKLMKELNFEESNMGKTSGSATRFKGKSNQLILHKPHPSNILKPYQIKEINLLLNILEMEGLL